MATDEDIVNALNGVSTREAARDEGIVNALSGVRAKESERNDALHRALNGLPSFTEEAANRAIVSEISGTPQSAMGLGVSQPDDYISQLGLEAAKASLRNRLMAADPTLTAGAAEFRVEAAAHAAYSAAEKHRYEADRLDSVTEALKAQTPTAKVREAKPAPRQAPQSVTPDKKPPTVERRTYTSIDGRVLAVFEGPVGGAAEQVR